VTDTKKITDAAADGVMAALLQEKQAYVARGLTERVAQVDEQLKLRGYRAGRATTKSTAPVEKRADDKSDQ